MNETPEELESWRARRQAELTSPESWLGLVALFWLEPGRNRVGSADDAIVRLPGGPACLGDLDLDETHGAGRFLKVPVAVDGKITLDFNFAYNPPCAFTAFATCPLPPPENWLPFAVLAGEKKWDKDA